MKTSIHSKMLDRLQNGKHKKGNIFERASQAVSEFTGTTLAFILAMTIVLGWLITGPIFNYSNTWQLVINTATTIVTFLMVFLIQRMQNKDSRAIHLKLNELVASLEGPSNRLIDVENMTENELAILSKFYRRLGEMSKKESDLTRSHSIEEAEQMHRTKYRNRRKKFSQQQPSQRPQFKKPATIQPADQTQQSDAQQQQTTEQKKDERRPSRHRRRKPKNKKSEPLITPQQSDIIE